MSLVLGYGGVNAALVQTAPSPKRQNKIITSIKNAAGEAITEYNGPFGAHFAVGDRCDVVPDQLAQLCLGEYTTTSVDIMSDQMMLVNKRLFVHQSILNNILKRVGGKIYAELVSTAKPCIASSARNLDITFKIIYGEQCEHILTYHKNILANISSEKMPCSCRDIHLKKYDHYPTISSIKLHKIGEKYKHQCAIHTIRQLKYMNDIDGMIVHGNVQ